MAKYQQMDMDAIIKHYQRPEILKLIVAASVDKEVVGSYGGKGYAKRPDIIEYENDIVTLVKSGVTSFHASEEIWEDPLDIQTGMKKDELSKMRKGWDLLLDIDCPVFEYSRIAAHLIIRAIQLYGVKNVSCKFSGNHGFHIGVPFESFPSLLNEIPTKELFPDIPRYIASLLAKEIADQLAEDLIAYEIGDDKSALARDKAVATIAEKIGCSPYDLFYEDGSGMNPFKVLDIDTIALTSRHLYRQIYAVNEKSGLVSIPINPAQVLRFKRSMAPLKNCPISRFGFLEREKSNSEEGKRLLFAAKDEMDKDLEEQTRLREEKELRQAQRASEFDQITEKIPTHCFPPTIKTMMGPLKDGKKRALFILSRFLRCCGYAPEEIIVTLNEWNKKHTEGLREAYMEGQMRYLKVHPDPIMPHNYESGAYDFIEVEKDELESRVKNPVSYAKIKYKQYLEAQKQMEKAQKKEAKKKAKDEAKIVKEKT